MDQQTTLKFLGAAQNVTGSAYHVRHNGLNLLIDCGLYQERGLRKRNWDPFPLAPETIDAVLLTHAHVDHCGLLPRLVREGFSGPIYCTEATAEIARIVLMDAAKLQEEDARFKKMRHEQEGRKGKYPEVPLYNLADAEACCRLLKPVPFDTVTPLADDVTATFIGAGHILGAAAIRLQLGGANAKRIVFSGDVGRSNNPLLPPPAPVGEADVVVVESTYGNRTHQPESTVLQNIESVVDRTWKAGGNLVIPAFAIERSQELMYYLNELLRADRIPHLMVFLDSPMAVAVTDVFSKYVDLLREKPAADLRAGHSPFEFLGLKLVRTVDESKAINHIRGTIAVMAGAGMCTGGRIKHHLSANIGRPESTIMFVGYQAVGTLGRLIADGAGEVRILGSNHAVQASVEQIHGFSAHADSDELLAWLDTVDGGPKRILVTHGEPEAAAAMVDKARARFGVDVDAPGFQDEIVL